MSNIEQKLHIGSEEAVKDGACSSIVGLSYTPKSHHFSDKKLQENYQKPCFYLGIKVFNNNEARITLKDSAELKSKSKVNPPPIRSGELVQDGLTGRARKKLLFASRILHNYIMSDKNQKGYCSFITLTYGKDFPDDRTSKRHLDNFFKKFRRKHPDSLYLWVAERQTRGAIHYHILTPHYTDYKWINKAWNGIANKWQISAGHKKQKLGPNVKGVLNAGAYLVKYLSKEGEKIEGNMYNMSQSLHNLMKPKAETTIKLKYDGNMIAEYLADKITDKKSNAVVFKNINQYTGNFMAWISKINEFEFNDFLNYEFLDFPVILGEYKNEDGVYIVDSPEVVNRQKPKKDILLK